MFNLRDLAVERREKLESMMTDCVSRETESFWTAFRARFSGVDPAKVEEAFSFNLQQDYGPRPQDRFYGVHPLRVARFQAGAVDPGSPHALDSVVAALVHNALEKKILDEEGLARRFGGWVARTVAILTPDRASLSTTEGLREYYERIRSSDPEVRQLKALDKFDNIFSLCLNPDDAVRENYIRELKGEVRRLVADDLPWLTEYFDRLVSDTEALGHYRPDFS